MRGFFAWVWESIKCGALHSFPERMRVLHIYSDGSTCRECLLCGHVYHVDFRAF